MKIKMLFKISLLLSASVLSCLAVPTTTNSITASGRNYFYDSERIDVVVPGDKDKSTVAFIHEDGATLSVEAPVQNGKIYLNLIPHALSQGKWNVQVAGKEAGTFNVVSAIPKTPFVMWNYQAWLDDSKDTAFGQMMGTGTTEERLKLYQDFGMNFLALQNGGFGMSIRTMDHLVQLGARYSSLNTMAGQHQPGGAHNDWSVPEVAQAVRFGVQHNAQYGLRYGAFAGVHYADEPALTYGTKNEKGQYEIYHSGHPIPDQSKNYFGPLAVPTQIDSFVKDTGKKPVDPLNPQANMEDWLAFMRYRTTILGKVFAQATSDLHAIDPKLIGYSQIYAWWFLVDGLYPFENGKGVDVLSSHGYIDNQFGMFYPISETEMIRTGAWNKPVWMMPMFEGMTRRSVTYASLSRQIEGLGWDRTASFKQPGMMELSNRIVPISGIFTQIKKKRDEVGVFYSRDQYLQEIAKDVKAADKSYAGRIVAAWITCFTAHYPANYVIEEDFASGDAFKYKVLVAPGLKDVSPSLKTALEKYVKDGGMLILDKDSTLQIAGATKLDAIFPDWTNTGKWNPQEVSMNEKQRFEKHILPITKILAETLKGTLMPLIEGGDPMLFASEQKGGLVRYIWAVNMNHETVNQESALDTNFVLPSSEATYDVFAGREVTGGKQSLTMPEGDATLYALLPDKIAKVTTKPPVVEPASVTISAAVESEKFPIAGVLPLEIEILDAKGKLFKKIYRATDATGQYKEKLALGHIAGAGEWKVNIKELLSGKTVQTSFKTASVEYAFALCGPVDVNDSAHIATALAQKDKTFLVLYGSDDMKAKADAVVKLLASKKIKAQSDKAENHKTERPGLANGAMYMSWGAFEAPLDIQQPMILVGDRKNNPLIARLIDKLSLYPHPVNDQFPGAGRGMIYWAKTVFGLNQDIIVIYGEEAASIDQATLALGQIALGNPTGGNATLKVKPPQ